MPNSESQQESIDRLRNAIKDVRIAMLSTISGGSLVARPMSMQEMSPEGTMWFLTSADSNKAKEIAENPSVCVSFCDTGSETYVSVAGLARMTNDRSRIREFWNPFYKAWFDGPDDPSIRVVEVQSRSAEYWITKGGKIVSLVSVLASAITGKDMEAGDNKTVQF